MSEMRIGVDPSVAHAALVGVVAQDLYRDETASVPALRLAWVGRGVDAESERRPHPVFRTGDRLRDSRYGFESPVMMGCAPAVRRARGRRPYVLEHQRSRHAREGAGDTAWPTA